MSKGDPRFLAILDEMKEIHVRKSADYGDQTDPLANVRASADWGISPWVGTMIRATDKIIRLQSLLTNGKLENESARDSLIDLASYAIIALILMEEEQMEEEQKKVNEQISQVHNKLTEYAGKAYKQDNFDPDGLC